MEFQLRPWRMDDLDSLVRHANNKKIANNLTNKFPHPYTREAGEAFINYATSDDPSHIFAIDIEEEACGGIGIHPQDDVSCKNAELGYWVAEPFWGNGIISRAIPQVVTYGFEHLDINRIFARPFGSNIASQKVLEKNGFILEAHLKGTFFKNGHFEDELIYAVRRK